MVISVGEPQLDRCLESVRSQTIPFTHILHTDGVIPNSTAFNQSIRKIKSEWAMHIAGDFILYPNAVEIASGYASLPGNDNICGYFFGLRDTFLECDTGYCAILRIPAFRQVEFMDTAFDDRKMPYRLRAMGWRFRKPHDIIATHFDSPSEFQVFGRFLFHACKFDDSNSYVRKRMNELLASTNNPLYEVGIDALDFASESREKCTGTPNIDFTRKMFVKFNEWRKGRNDRPDKG